MAGRLKRIPIEWLTNEFAFSFAPEGWNYFRALVAERDREPGLALEHSTFFKFFRHERVQSLRDLNDVLFFHDPARASRREGFRFPLGTYPWGDHVAGGPWGYHYDQSAHRNTRDLYGYRRNLWYRPGDCHPLEIEWKKTIGLYQSLKAGYRPLLAGGWPQVTLLVKRSGELRAVRYDGQHRFAILSHLGRKKVTALIPSAHSIRASLESWPTFSSLPKTVDAHEIIVRENEVERWPYVQRGLCSREQALEIFHAFFDLNGRERIACLGLPAVY